MKLSIAGGGLHLAATRHRTVVSSAAWVCSSLVALALCLVGPTDGLAIDSSRKGVPIFKNFPQLQIDVDKQAEQHQERTFKEP